MTATSHIEFIPRSRVVFPVLGPDHPMVDQFGKPTTWDEPGCTEIVVVGWPNKFTEWADSAENFTILRGYQYYVHEWMKRKQQDVRRFSIVARYVCGFFGPGMDPTKMNIAAGKRYEDWRYAAGVTPPTVLKEVRMHLAAMNHNFKRERIEKVPFMEMPEGQGQERRPLTEDEWRLLMRLPMPYRRRMFWRLDYHTGHRARAIETLPWSRVFFDTLTINFNDPAMRKTNKRRADGFPIEPQLLTILLAAKERHDRLTPDDPYVIGLSPKGKCTPTYKGCKQDLKKIGVDVKGLCRHAVRKLFCTSRIANGKSSALVAALIADDERTMKRHYVRLSSDDMRDAARNERAA